MRSILRSLCLAIALGASSFVAQEARATVLCCEIFNNATCQYYQSACPPVDPGHHYISVAVPPGGLLDKGARVEFQWVAGVGGSGLCFKQAATPGAAGEYVAPAACLRLVAAPPTPLVQVSEDYTPWEGNAFSFEVTYSFTDFFGDKFMTCYSGSDLKDERGVATHAVGTGYTCGPLRQMWWTTSGVQGGNFHYLATVNNAPNLGINPRLYAGYGAHLVGHYDLFLVRVGAPSAAIGWHRTINGVVQPTVVLGFTDQYGSADVWGVPGPAWKSSDAGTNTLFVNGVNIFTSNTLTFTVE